MAGAPCAVTWLAQVLKPACFVHVQERPSLTAETFCGVAWSLQVVVSKLKKSAGERDMLRQHATYLF